MSSQQLTLYDQFNGRYDYVAIGNTMNLAENNTTSVCQILTQSSAQLNLLPTQNIIAAYLYWSGSGSGDFDVTLNGVQITAQRTFSYSFSSVYTFFGAFADVTTQLQNTQNGTYTLSDLDLTQVIPNYCINSTNYGGWAIIVIYEDNSLNYNQINVYDGFDGLQNSTINFTIDNIFVANTNSAKCGFLVWEGDTMPNHSSGESILINGNIIADPPLNPNGSIFNGTNSFTQSNDLWNMDIDNFDISSAVQIGDTQAQITLTTGQDLVILNTIVTVLSNELPDATIMIDDLIAGQLCGDSEIHIEYTVHNTNGTAPLPANTPIAFYADEVLIATAATQNEIPVNGSESQEITITISPEIPVDFSLRIVVDDTGDGTGIVLEIDEENNEASHDIHLLLFPEMADISNQIVCNNTDEQSFNLQLSTAEINIDYNISFHENQNDAENNLNPISDPENYIPINNPQSIFVRVDNGDCYVIESFVIELIVCPLPDATISIDNELFPCRQRDLLIAYTVYNTNGTAVLPSKTPIAFYANETLVDTDETQKEISIGGHASQQKTINLPEWLPDAFELTLRVDDLGDGTGIVDELDETNNTATQTTVFGSIGELPPLPDLTACNEGFGFATFDLTQQYEWIPQNSDIEIAFYTSYHDALAEMNAVWNPENFKSNSNPQTLFVRMETQVCFTIGSFDVGTEDCPPWIPQGFSPNSDFINDYFEITGLLDVYPNHEIRIYTRNGNLIFIGNNDTGHWDGTTNHGFLFDGPVPPGVYYYVLDLKHPGSEVFTGWVYLNK